MLLPHQRSDRSDLPMHLLRMFGSNSRQSLCGHRGRPARRYIRGAERAHVRRSERASFPLPILSTNWISAGWAILENKATGAQYVHINTHLFVGDAAIRTKEYEVLSTKIKEFTDKGYKVFVTGDFNTSTASDIYKGLTTNLLDARIIHQNNAVRQVERFILIVCNI